MLWEKYRDWLPSDSTRGRASVGMATPDPVGFFGRSHGVFFHGEGEGFVLGAVKPVNKTAVFRFIPKKKNMGEKTCKNKQHKLFSNMMNWKFSKK